MNKESRRIVLTNEIIQRFASYYSKPNNGAWGSLHIVLDDGNVNDEDVKFCIQYAKRKEDSEGEELANVLLQMSKTQRLKLSYKVEQAIDRKDDGTIKVIRGVTFIESPNSLKNK